MAELVLQRYGRVEVGLIGFNPAIAERLVDTFGAQHLRITDLNGDNIGTQRFGVEIWDGNDRTEELIDASDVVVLTGTSLVNGTFDRIWRRIRTRGKAYLVYVVTAAGVSELLGIDRICPCGRGSLSHNEHTTNGRYDGLCTGFTQSISPVDHVDRRFHRPARPGRVVSYPSVRSRDSPSRKRTEPARPCDRRADQPRCPPTI